MCRLSRGQILYFDENGALFIRPKERHGQCKIKRLSGSLRVAEDVLLQITAFLHLCRFCNDRKRDRHNDLCLICAVSGKLHPVPAWIVSGQISLEESKLSSNHW